MEMYWAVAVGLSLSATIDYAFFKIQQPSMSGPPHHQLSMQSRPFPRPLRGMKLMFLQPHKKETLKSNMVITKPCKIEFLKNQPQTGPDEVGCPLI